MSQEHNEQRIQASTEVHTVPGSIVEGRGFSVEKTKLLGLAAFILSTSIIAYEHYQGRPVDSSLYFALGASLVLLRI